MGLFDRVERRLESVVNGAFARAFKAEVQPVEIASAMRRAMDDRAAVVGEGRTLVPNVFTVELAASDFERLTSYEQLLADELMASVEEHAESQRYVPGGPIVVRFSTDDALETGVFRVRAAADKYAERATPQPAPAHPGPARPDPAREATPPPPRLPRAPRPSESTAEAEGVVGAAGQAAAAAGGALAGTAAAARANLPDPLAAWSGDDMPDADSSGWAAQSGPNQPTAAHQVVAAPPAAPPPRVNPAERPRLEIDGDTYPLVLAMTIIGRDPSADITLDDPGISRRHSEIRVTHDGPHFIVTVRDLGSTNGTFLNGERITSARATDGDRLTLGRTSLHLRIGRR